MLSGIFLAESNFIISLLSVPRGAAVHQTLYSSIMAGDNWTREQLILAFNLYCKLPFGRLHHRNLQII